MNHPYNNESTRDEHELPYLNAYIKKEQRKGDICLRQADLSQRPGKSKTV